MSLINHKCKRCNRELKSKKSQELGYGPTYYRIMKLQEKEKPKDHIDDITFLKMEIRTLKTMFRQLRQNGIKTIDRIDRIKIDVKPEQNQIKNQFSQCVKELKGIFEVDNWDYRDVLSHPRETIENPPIIPITI